MNRILDQKMSEEEKRAIRRQISTIIQPQAVMVLDKKAQEGLRKQLEDLRRDGLEACGLTEEDVKERFLKLTDNTE